MKKLFFIALATLSLMACTKEGPQGQPGAQGVQGPQGPDAKTFEYNLTFNPGDTYKSYSGITGFDSGDVVVTYVFNASYGGESYYVQTPYAAGNLYVWTEFGGSNGNIFVNTTRADGVAGSPWTATTTLSFKSVLIKSSGLIKNPDLDLSNYNEVKEAFNL